MDFDDCVRIFEHIFHKINLLTSTETLDKRDIERLLELMNYKKDGQISVDEFHIFYFKSILGS